MKFIIVLLIIATISCGYCLPVTRRQADKQQYDQCSPNCFESIIKSAQTLIDRHLQVSPDYVKMMNRQCHPGCVDDVLHHTYYGSQVPGEEAEEQQYGPEYARWMNNINNLIRSQIPKEQLAEKQQFGPEYAKLIDSANALRSQIPKEEAEDQFFTVPYPLKSAKEQQTTVWSTLRPTRYSKQDMEAAVENLLQKMSEE